MLSSILRVSWSFYLLCQYFMKMTLLLSGNFGSSLWPQNFRERCLLFSTILPKKMLEKNEIGIYSRSLIMSSLQTGLALADLALKTKSLFLNCCMGGQRSSHRGICEQEFSFRRRVWITRFYSTGAFKVLFYTMLWVWEPRFYLMLCWIVSNISYCNFD